MKSLRWVSLWVLAVLASPLQAADLTVTTGGTEGTYIQFGREIAEVAKQEGVELAVESSRGSIHNLKRLLGYEGVEDRQFFQLAIIQEDVLADLRRYARGNDILEGIVGKVKMVMPLYDEEVHVFVPADSGIDTFSDLRNRMLGVGRPSSGTYMTARFLHLLSGMTWEPQQGFIVDAGGVDGLELLRVNGLDALFQVAGAPAALGSSSVSIDDRLKLVEISDPSIFEAPGSPYKRAVLDERIYPWLDAPVETAAVGSVLVAYDYDGEHCVNIGKVAKAIVDNLEVLQREGHPKWRQVDPRAALNRPDDLYDCVRDALE